jgi:hypothetical protein
MSLEKKNRSNKKKVAEKATGKEESIDISLSQAILETIVSPVVGPARIVKEIVDIALAETGTLHDLEDKLIEFKMYQEMGEISEEEYKEKEAELEKQIKEAEISTKNLEE